MRFSISDRFYLNKDPIPERESETSSSIPIILYKKRFLINFILSLNLFLNGIFWISFNSITNILTVYFNKSERDINWFSNVFFVFPGITAIISIFLPNIIGLRKCLVLGGLLHMIGALFRYFGVFLYYFTPHNKYIMCMIGSSFLAVSQGIILNLPSFLSAKWFGINERDLSTAVCFLFSLIGVSFGYLIPFSIMQKYHTPDQYQYGFQIIVSVEFALTIIVMILTIIWAEDRPQTPPSKSEIASIFIKSNLTSKEILLDSLKQTRNLFKSVKMAVLLFNYALFYTNSNLISTYLSEMMDHFNKDYIRLSGYMGAGATIAGAFGTLFFGLLAGKLGENSNQKISAFVNGICALMSTLILVVNEIGYNNNYSIVPLFIMWGFHADAFLSLGFELMANISYPSEPNISANAGLFVGNVVGSVVLSFSGILNQTQKHRFSYVFAITAYALNAVVFLFVKFKNKRHIAEQ